MLSTFLIIKPSYRTRKINLVILIYSSVITAKITHVIAKKYAVYAKQTAIIVAGTTRLSLITIPLASIINRAKIAPIIL